MADPLAEYWAFCAVAEFEANEATHKPDSNQIGKAGMPELVEYAKAARCGCIL